MADDRQGLFARPDAPHSVHDLLLIAAFAADDVTQEDRQRAAALVAGCTDCASLAADLRAIQLATATIPTPPRTRDFRLTTADAERLRPHGVRRFVSAVSRPRLSRAHPIAAGLTMLGLAGLLVSSISFGGNASAPTADGGGTDTNTELLQEQPSPGAEFGAQAVDPSPRDEASAPPQIRVTPTSTSASGQRPTPPGAPADPTRNAVAIGSALLVVAGIALFVGAGWRRRRSG